MLHKTCPVHIKAAGPNEGTDDGVFEALVSVFGNKDLYGDVVQPGAFTDTLAEWAAKGDPIPVYWSHQLGDPDMNLGQVIEARETDQGLWVRAQLDLDAAKAAQVYRLLKGRRVTQFSFTYDIVEGAYVESDDHGQYYELRKVKLHEVGPCAVGANQATELLAVKAARAGAALRTADDDQLREVMALLDEALMDRAKTSPATGDGASTENDGKAKAGAPAAGDPPSPASPTRRVLADLSDAQHLLLTADAAI